MKFDWSSPASKMLNYSLMHSLFAQTEMKKKDKQINSNHHKIKSLQ